MDFAERAARNEEVFRRANEGIEAGAQQHHVSGSLSYHCECGAASVSTRSRFRTHGTRPSSRALPLRRHPWAPRAVHRTSRRVRNGLPRCGKDRRSATADRPRPPTARPPRIDRAERPPSHGSSQFVAPSGSVHDRSLAQCPLPLTWRIKIPRREQESSGRVGLHLARWCDPAVRPNPRFAWRVIADGNDARDLYAHDQHHEPSSRRTARHARPRRDTHSPRRPDRGRAGVGSGTHVPRRGAPPAAPAGSDLAV